MLRRIGWAFAGVLLLLLLWIGGTGVAAYQTAPGLVRDLERRGALPLDPRALPAKRICALLAVQDATFFRHRGIGLLDGPPLHTTLTQSICKGLYFDGFSPGVLRYRKFMLMADAFAFDRRVPKWTQLRIFVNRAFLGSSAGQEVLGFSAAARAYFRKDVTALDDREWLSLLAMLREPETYHVVLKPADNAARVESLEPAVESWCSRDCGSGPFEPCRSTHAGAPTKR